MISQKVQLEESDVEFIRRACKLLRYRSRSQYIRDAIKDKIRADRARLRESRRQKAMQAYGEDEFDRPFEAIEGEDFADR